MIWTSGQDERGEHVNRRLDFTGRTLAEELAVAWDEKVHPEDLPAAGGELREAVAARRPYQLLPAPIGWYNPARLDELARLY